MGIRVALHHKTVYKYDRLVTLGPQVVRLRPAPHSRTPVVSYSLRIEPKAHFINWQQDPQSNYLARIVIPDPTARFSLEVDLVAEMTVVNPFDFFLEPYADKFPFVYEESLARELTPFLEKLPADENFSRFMKSLDLTEARTIDFLVELNRRVQNAVGYLIRMEPGVQTPEQTLTLATGSCRDSSWLMVQVLRHLGLAARFVSGYLIQLKPDVKALDGPSGTEFDFTDLHAWAEVYLPGAGWVGLDPTSGLFAGEGHIPVAATPDPQSAAPVSGAVGNCEVEFDHEMTVTRIHEDPRVTKPYTDDQWERILTLGDKIDAEFADGDVRLTMGGEPTFVSIDDVDGEEWNTAAIGPNKRRLAGNLLSRLRDHFAPGGLLHFGQGKWYPGESLPRWAYTCYWRTDGFPLWQDPHWVGQPDHDYGYGLEHAEDFAIELTKRLRIDDEFLITAYEDPLEYLHAERKLPLNVDPIDNKMDDPEARERLRRTFERGLDAPTGYVLPLQYMRRKNGLEWQSGLWMLRARHLYLVPGDSPIGFRLPVSALPWEPVGKRQRIVPPDPMAPLGPLPVPREIYQAGLKKQAQRRPPPKSKDTAQQRGPVVRTALAVEAREGRLYVFLPPVETTEAYVELVAAIEDTAARLEMPVLIEGYTPPSDPRLKQIRVTPDPGVIEVNTQPAFSWTELVANTVELYEQARLTRLGTEKFMIDGRHTGTGGGNHLVLGGPTPADSPFLRRPDLLRSLLGYWVNHPALSYLFSGVFIGPTSQAPRVDETRPDAVYELEIAFSLLDDNQSGKPDECPPWLVDRLFRDLLADGTGNTHRAEFCIDKLYSPDTSSGRLGLLELRAFEMPPHARMSLAQQLLVRALVARFWKTPYCDPPIRWGTRLHDRYLLPYYVEKDFSLVAEELRDAGYLMETAWFAPHIEFRFPVYGRVNYGGIEIELRQAIEPWYVLGEEPGGGATARYVDSSVERMQVRVTGLIPERYAVTCNGRRLPLQSTGTQGDYVCGVRYRAWQPPRCLHPTIPVHTPLVFDLVDLAAGRPIGGCIYHVGHPGGRSYDTFAVNSNEAEARRRARFLAFGHTPGKMSAPPLEENPEFPSTLDLRREPRSDGLRRKDSRGVLA
jgi:uncharacterized protein (DUF2126 family)/transglutaminase-like putative cysteine protease